MLYGVFGLPGSGKSYIVVKDFILDRIVKGTVVSNVKLNGKVTLENYIYLEKNDVDNFHSNVKRIVENDENSHDDKKELIRHLVGLYSNGGKGDITFIIDEAHLYGYRGRSSNISWADDWISIHRHCNGDNKLDLVLITQVPSRLNTEIGGQVEVAIQAVPSSQRVSKALLEYSYYASLSGLKSADKDLRTKRLITRGNANIFDVYESGYVQEGSADFRKKMYIMVFALVGVVAYTLNSFMSLGDNTMDTVDNKEVSEEIKKVPLASLNKSVETDVKEIVTKPKLYANGAEYKIICRTVPLDFDYDKVKDYFYVVKKKNGYEICHKKYRS